MKKWFSWVHPLGVWLSFLSSACPVPGAQFFQTYENYSPKPAIAISRFPIAN